MDPAAMQECLSRMTDEVFHGDENSASALFVRQPVLLLESDRVRPLVRLMVEELKATLPEVCVVWGVLGRAGCAWRCVVCVGALRNKTASFFERFYVFTSSVYLPTAVFVCTTVRYLVHQKPPGVKRGVTCCCGLVRIDVSRRGEHWLVMPRFVLQKQRTWTV